jgi:hypothetical protein
MRTTDVVIFGDCAWNIREIMGDKVRLLLLAGPKEEHKTSVVPIRMLQGRPFYRQVSALEDVDLDRASEEATGDLDVSSLGHDPRKWTEAFQRRYGSRITPDATLMLGWLATAMEAGSKKPLVKTRFARAVANKPAAKKPTAKKATKKAKPKTKPARKR